MRIDSSHTLRATKLPVSVTEVLTLLQAVRAEVIGPLVDDFHFPARTTPAGLEGAMRLLGAWPARA